VNGFAWGLLFGAFFSVILVIYWLTEKPKKTPYPHFDKHLHDQTYERLLKREVELAAQFQRKTKMVDVGPITPPIDLGVKDALTKPKE
jgi:hypothetical protein